MVFCLCSFLFYANKITKFFQLTKKNLIIIFYKPIMKNINSPSAKRFLKKLFMFYRKHQGVFLNSPQSTQSITEFLKFFRRSIKRKTQCDSVLLRGEPKKKTATSPTGSSGSSISRTDCYLSIVTKVISPALIKSLWLMRYLLYFLPSSLISLM